MAGFILFPNAANRIHPKPLVKIVLFIGLLNVFTSCDT